MATFNLLTTEHGAGSSSWKTDFPASSAVAITTTTLHRLRFWKIGSGGTIIKNASLDLYFSSGQGSTLTLDLFVTNNASLTPAQTSSMTNIGTTAKVLPAPLTSVSFSIPQAGLNAIGAQTGTWYLVLKWVSGPNPGIITPGGTTQRGARLTGEYDEGLVSTNVGGTWRKGPIWVNASGTWKQGIPWTNVGGTWKQGI